MTERRAAVDDVERRWQLAADVHAESLRTVFGRPASTSAGPQSDTTDLCGAVAVLAELQHVWTYALLDLADASRDDVVHTRPRPRERAAQLRVAAFLDDADQRYSSRALRHMAYWSTLGLTGRWATLVMDQHRLAGAMMPSILNGALRLCRRSLPRIEHLLDTRPLSPSLLGSPPTGDAGAAPHARAAGLLTSPAPPSAANPHSAANPPSATPLRPPPAQRPTTHAQSGRGQRR